MIFFLFSCQTTKNKTPYENFQEINEIKAEPIELNQKIDRVLFIENINNYLVILDPFNNNNTLKLIDPSTNSIIKSFGKKGRGPGEFISPSSLTKIENQSNSFELYDINLRKIIEYSIDSVINSKNYFPNFKKNFSQPTGSLTGVISLDSVYVGIGIFEQGKYLLIDKKNLIKSYELNYPEDKSRKDSKNKHKAMAYQGKIVKRPKHNEFVFASSNCDYLEICKYDNGELTEVKEAITYHPKYTIQTKAKGFGIQWDADNPNGYVDMRVSENYIFALYSGRTFNEYKFDVAYGEHLLVYDWKGNPIKYFKLDTPLQCISSPNINNEIFGIANIPEPRIIKLKLDIK